jgi:hypothetical protein
MRLRRPQLLVRTGRQRSDRMVAHARNSSMDAACCSSIDAAMEAPVAVNLAMRHSASVVTLTSRGCTATPAAGGRVASGSSSVHDDVDRVGQDAGGAQALADGDDVTGLGGGGEGWAKGSICGGGG